MKHFVLTLFLTLVFSGLFSNPIDSIPSKTFQNKKIIVGTKEAVPFVIKNSDGTYSGIAIDLWERIAVANQWQYEYREYDLPDLLENIKCGGVDVAVGALTISKDRERYMDFSYPYYVSGFSIATRTAENSVTDMLAAIFTLDLFKAVGGLVFILFVVGMLVWFFERKNNPQQFGGNTFNGIGAGFWWSAVTMTTVGYGDKAPVTPIGRIIALVWMFLALIMISSFTAAITSALTMNKLNSSIKSPDDLKKVETGTVFSSSSETYLTNLQLRNNPYDNLSAALGALADEKVDAVVYDEPILRYSIKNHSNKSEMIVLPYQIKQFYYGLAVPEGSKLRELINQELLKQINSSKWDQTMYFYLGEE